MADEGMMPMDEMEDAGAEAPAEGSGRNPIMRYLPLIGGLLFVQVALAFFVAKWFFTTDASHDPATAQEETQQEAQSGFGFRDGRYLPPPVDFKHLFDQIGVIVVNPAQTEGMRFLSVKISLGLADARVESHIVSKNLTPRLRDILVRTLSSKTVPELDSARHPELKDSIRAELNRFLGSNAVVQVFFPEFVLQ